MLAGTLFVSRLTDGRSLLELIELPIDLMLEGGMAVV